MDVRLRKNRLISLILLLACPWIGSCGSRYDTSTQSGRQAIINDANLHLTHGECQLAYNDIIKLYGTTNSDEQVQLVMASTWACFAGFNMLNMAADISGASNYFTMLAKDLPSSLNDGHITSMYKSVDVLTSYGTALTGASRSASLNNYMVFIQAGVIGAIISSYGKATSAGVKTAALTYHTPPVGSDLTTLDACALGAAMSILVDSFSYSSFSDTATLAMEKSLNSACVSAGLASCSAINQDRTKCTGLGTDANSVVATGVVTAVNSDW